MDWLRDLGTAFFLLLAAAVSAIEPDGSDGLDHVEADPVVEGWQDYAEVSGNVSPVVVKAQNRMMNRQAQVEEDLSEQSSGDGSGGVVQEEGDSLQWFTEETAVRTIREHVHDITTTTSDY